MTSSNTVILVPKNAAEDLSSAKYRAVKLDTDGAVVQVAVTTDIPFGILQNAPVTDEAASVCPIGAGGSSKVYAAEVIGADDLVGLDGSGEAVAAASGRYTIGQCEEAGNTDDLIKVMLSNITVKA